jgi:hypothetical protein
MQPYSDHRPQGTALTESLYKEGSISLGKAAKLAKMSIAEPATQPKPARYRDSKL